MAAAVVDTDLEESLDRGTRRGQKLLDKLQLSEAQSVYWQVLRLCSSPGVATSPGTCQRAMVTAVSGLAETFARQSRTHGQHETAVPWLRLNIQVSTTTHFSSFIVN